MSDMVDKLLNKQFCKVKDVVLDFTTNSMGIIKNDSIITPNITTSEDGKKEYNLTENIFAEMSVSVPCFATRTNLSDIAEGDIVLNSEGVPIGWVVDKVENSIKVLKPSGTVSKMKLTTTSFLSSEGAILVVRNPLGNNPQSNQIQQMLPLLLMKEGDTDKSGMLMAMLMQNAGKMGGNTDTTNQMNPLMIAMLMDGDGGNKESLLPLLLSGGLGNGAQGMDPMMMAVLLSRKK